MDYLKSLFACCKGDTPSTIQITVSSACCKSKTKIIIVTNEEDVQKLTKLLEELQTSHHSQRKSSLTI
jgi:hypothetical protein